MSRPGHQVRPLSRKTLRRRALRPHPARPRPARHRGSQQAARQTARPLRARHLVCLALAACLALAGCSLLPGSTPTSSSPPATEAVVASTAPTDASQYTCPGIPDAALEAMFGTGITVSSSHNGDTNTGGSAPECRIYLPDKDTSVFRSEFWYLYNEELSPLGERSGLVWGRSKSTFTFEEVKGAGQLGVDTGSDRENGASVFVCGDHYLALNITEASAAAGDMRANLVNLTRSALPWLCQGEVVPGSTQTLEEARPPFAYVTPQATP